MASKALSLHEMAFADLPDWRRVWPGAPGSREEGLGRLVLLTPERILSAASSCIKTGRHTGLNWDLNKLEVANFGRQPCQHHVLPLMGGAAFDDIYIFNPQQSSQWDGLRHFSQPSEDGNGPRTFYGGVTASEIMDRKNTRIGIQYWAQHGFCGRGVLLDYASYAKRHQILYSTFSDHSVPISVLVDIAKEQGTTFQRGDILFFRMGLMEEWSTHMTAKQKNDYATTSSPLHAGVQGTMETLQWIWDEGFSAIASDNLSFEIYPPKKEYSRQGGDPVKGLFMHEYLLPGWGMPIGELFDLDGLAKICEEENRWEFFVTSAPLNMPGGVSSPPNCVAVF